MDRWKIKWKKITGTESMYRGHMTAYIKVKDAPPLPQCLSVIFCKLSGRKLCFFRGVGGLFSYLCVYGFKLI